MLIQRELLRGSIARARRSSVEALVRSLPSTEAPRSMKPEQRRARRATLVAQLGNEEAADRALERLIGGNDLVGVSYLELGVSSARSVCRVRLRDAGGRTLGFGTGFLVAPGVLMTNHHVIAGADDARYAVAEFDYEQDVAGNDKPVAAFPILADPQPLALRELDFCLAGVAGRSQDGARSLDEFGWLPLDPTPGKTVLGEYLSIVQHPGGERKQVCVRENKLLRYDELENTVWYMTDTVAGSSGSPVFNGAWQVVALHHSGVPKTDAQGRWLGVDGRPVDPATADESRVAWIANEGIRISRIVEYLRAARAGDALGAAVLRHAGVHATAPHPAELAPRAELRDGELRLTIPVQLAVRLGPAGLPGAVTAAAAQASTGWDAAAAPAVLPAPDATAVERVSVDQSNYSERPGYDPEFLGKGELRVPPPALLPRLREEAFLDGKQVTLPYWNYSVVMNPARKLAVLSAANVDAGLRPQNAGRDGDRWYFDPRLAESYQLGPGFYAEQSTFELDRSANPFDRGHLTRRLDAQWGRGDEAKRNGDDSFHWTNCSPQHWKFNQGAKRWLGLEDYVIQAFAGRGARACVINGPVFDAPRSVRGEDGRLVPVVDPGKGERDPTFGGVLVPKLFFKVVACLRDGALAAAAFLLSQEDLLLETDRVRGLDEILTDEEAKLYQVSVAELGNLAGLDFGPLVAADTLARGREEAARGVRRLDEIEQAFLGGAAAPGRGPSRAA